MEYREGSLYVVRDEAPPASISQSLKSIDPRLFLEQQVTYRNELVWCVVVDIGGDRPPITLMEWRDESGRPLELSSGIIDRMQRMDRDAKTLTAKVAEKNRVRDEIKTRDNEEQYRELGRDWNKVSGAGHAGLLPRGASLRMARDKARNRGEKI
jgi:hypothetical protein